MMRVLHSVGQYLNLSENWIYPQIAHVPGVQGRVICNSVINADAFPNGSRGIIIHPPPGGSGFGIPRLVYRIGRRLRMEGGLCRSRIRLWRPSALHAHFGPRGFECLPWKQALRIPLLTSFYGYDAWMLPQKEPAWLARYQELFAQGDAFLVEGPAMRQRLMRLGCPPEKVFIQRIGVDTTKIPFNPQAPRSPLAIVMVGRFVPKKGLTDGLAACRVARARGVDLKVTVIGDASNGDPAGRQIKEDLTKLAATPELGSRVEFTGFLPMERTGETVRAHQVFLCPSRHASDGDAEGGSPVVLTEAMAAGLICVGTRHCDIPEVILHGETGYLAEEGNVSQLADTLCGLSADPAATATMAKRGRKHIEERFALGTQMLHLRQLYASMVDSDRVNPARE